MSFITYNTEYYRNKLAQYEGKKLEKETIYEAKQLLKMLDDLIDEGYYGLNTKIEEEYQGVSRLRKLIIEQGETPFAIVKKDSPKAMYFSSETYEVKQYMNQLVHSAMLRSKESNRLTLPDIADYCKWMINSEKLSQESMNDTAYIFLFRDTLLPYIYFMTYAKNNQMQLQLEPWIIGRKLMDILSPDHNIDDIIRGEFFDALEADCSNFSQFLHFCSEKMKGDLVDYPEVIQPIKELLATIKAKRILVIESGCYGTFPMLLAALDDRVDFRMYTTVPYLLPVYGKRIYTKAYENNRLFETCTCQDKLMELVDYKNHGFYIHENADSTTKEDALDEIYSMINLAM